MLGTDGSHDIGSATIKVGLQESHVGVLFNNNVHDSSGTDLDLVLFSLSCLKFKFLNNFLELRL